ncbi:MAG TPA: prolipoprotein diacylglyceryl transferase [Clostridiaceae bacterium]|nr:prolipoprotein diacylglyceryl transferase [Clostridiaceae bacterium]
MNTIEFPKLGIKFTIDNVAFRIFGIEIFWYGIIIAFAFLLAVLLGLKDSKKYNINQDNLIDVILWFTPASIIGARLYYVIFSWDEFKNNPIDILNTRKGGLAIYGGVIAALITVFIFAKVKKINALEYLDFGIVYVPLAQAIGRWGNFVNQEAFGKNTDLPWGMTGNIIKNQLQINADRLSKMGIIVDPSKPVHPTFLYESLWNIGVFILLFFFRKRKKVDGEVLLLYGILYGLGRAWIEGLRTDSLMVGNLRVSQFLSIIIVIVFSIILYVRRKKYILLLEETPQIGLSEYGKLLKIIKEQESAYSESSEASQGENENESSTDNVGDSGSVEHIDQTDEINDNESKEKNKNDNITNNANNHINDSINGNKSDN